MNVNILPFLILGSTELDVLSYPETCFPCQLKVACKGRHTDTADTNEINVMYILNAHFYVLNTFSISSTICFVASGLANCLILALSSISFIFRYQHLLEYYLKLGIQIFFPDQYRCILRFQCPGIFGLMVLGHIWRRNE